MLKLGILTSFGLVVGEEDCGAVSEKAESTPLETGTQWLWYLWFDKPKLNKSGICSVNSFCVWSE